MKKKILSVILVLSMLLAFMPVIAVAETSGTCGDNVTWTLDDEGTLTISGTGDMKNWLNNVSYSSPFNGNSNIKSIVIENGVTSIGDWAFEYCDGLTSVKIGNDVTVIGKAAFGKCSSLLDITIPDNVTTIRDGDYTDWGTYRHFGAFYGCNNLTSVTIGKGITYMGVGAFNGCNKLDSVYISDLTAYLNIDFKVGYNDYTYTSNPMCYANKLYLNNKRIAGTLTIPDGVKKIPLRAFDGCDSLNKIIIPDSVTSIDDCAFEDCSELTSVNIPDSVTIIGESVFSGCTEIYNVKGEFDRPIKFT